MTDCNVLLTIHPMIGVDIHQVILPPAPPAVAPYFVMQILNGLGIKADHAKKTYCLSFQTMAKGTDIGNFIVHVGNPANIKLPFIIAFSGSKSMFGASTVKIENKIVATACFIYSNINNNCNFPCSLPNGAVIATNTVMAGMSIGDYIAGAINMVIDSAIGFGIGKLTGGVSGSKMVNNFIASRVSSEAWKFVIGEAFATAMNEGIGAIQGLIGADPSSAVDGVVDYFNQPTIEEFGAIPEPN